MLLEKSKQIAPEGMKILNQSRNNAQLFGGESKVQCYKEQYCIRTWNVRPMNQSRLEVVKEEMHG